MLPSSNITLELYWQGAYSSSKKWDIGTVERVLQKSPREEFLCAFISAFHQFPSML